MKEKHLKLRVAAATRRQRAVRSGPGGCGLAHGRARRAGVAAAGRHPRSRFHRGLQHPSRLRRVQLTCRTSPARLPATAADASDSLVRLYSRRYSGDSIHHRWRLRSQQVCSSCGNPALPDGKFCLFCGDVLTESLRKALDIADPPNAESRIKLVATRRAAGVRRFLAAGLGGHDRRLPGSHRCACCLLVIVDLSLRYCVQLDELRAESHHGVATSPASPSSLVLAIGAWLYCAFTESSEWRATIGKRIMGLQVVTASGGQAVVWTGHGPPLHEVPLAVHRRRRIHDGRLDQAPPGAARHAFRLHRHPRRRPRALLDPARASSSAVPPRCRLAAANRSGVISKPDVSIRRSGPQMAGGVCRRPPRRGYRLVLHRPNQGEAHSCTAFPSNWASTFSRPAKASRSPSPRAGARSTPFAPPRRCSSRRAATPTSRTCTSWSTARRTIVTTRSTARSSPTIRESGDINAIGEVHIDLQGYAEGPDQARPGAARGAEEPDPHHHQFAHLQSEDGHRPHRRRGGVSHPAGLRHGQGRVLRLRRPTSCS